MAHGGYGMTVDGVDGLDWLHGISMTLGKVLIGLEQCVSGGGPGVSPGCLELSGRLCLVRGSSGEMFDRVGGLEWLG